MKSHLETLQIQHHKCRTVLAKIQPVNAFAKTIKNHWSKKLEMMEKRQMNCIEQEAQSDSLSSQISEQQFLVDIWRGVKALAKYKSKELSGKLEKKEATMKGMDV